MRNLILVVLLFISGSAHAEKQRYNFTNPTFGGNPFVSNHMLNLATRQYEVPTASRETKSELQTFADQIRRRTLSTLSSTLASNIRQISLDDFKEGEGFISLDGIEINYFSGDDCNIILELLSEDGEEIVLDIPDFSCEQ